MPSPRRSRCAVAGRPRTDAGTGAWRLRETGSRRRSAARVILLGQPRGRDRCATAAARQERARSFARGRGSARRPGPRRRCHCPKPSQLRPRQGEQIAVSEHRRATEADARGSGEPDACQSRCRFAASGLAGKPVNPPGREPHSEVPDDDRVRLTVPAVRDSQSGDLEDRRAHRTLSLRVRPELCVIASAMRLTPRDTAPIARAGTIV